MALAQEINVTKFVNEQLLDGEPSNFCASVMERGANAGTLTYNHAVSEFENYPIVNTETRPIIIEYFSHFGAWTLEEMTAWSDAELNGVVLQHLTSEYKEWDVLEDDSTIFCDESEENFYFYFGM